MFYGCIRNMRRRCETAFQEREVCRQQLVDQQRNQITSVPLLLFSLSLWSTWTIFSLTSTIFSTPSPIPAQKKFRSQKKIHLERTKRVMWLPGPMGSSEKLSPRLHEKLSSQPPLCLPWLCNPLQLSGFV